MKYYGLKINYLILLICTFGYIWIFFNLPNTPSSTINTTGFNVCIFKNVTDLPCPSCGTTRAVSFILHGDFYKSLMLNPFGIIIISIILIFPFWIIFDLIFKKSSFETWFINLNQLFKKKWIVLSFVIIVILNWIWNIYKNV
jgi:hypothetical protein